MREHGICHAAGLAGLRHASPGDIDVVEPSDALRERAASAGVNAVASSADLAASPVPALVVVAVKPQVIGAVVPEYRRFAEAGSTVLSVCRRRRTALRPELGSARHHSTAITDFSTSPCSWASRPCCLPSWLFVLAPVWHYLRTPNYRENVLLADLCLMIVAFLVMNSALESFFLRRADPAWLTLVIALTGLRLCSRLRLRDC